MHCLGICMEGVGFCHLPSVNVVDEILKNVIMGILLDRDFYFSLLNLCPQNREGGYFPVYIIR